MPRQNRNRGGGSPGPSPLILNQDRLRAYDAASAQDDRAEYMQGKQQLEGDKFNFQQQKEAFNESLKQTAAEQRAREFETTSNIRGEALDSLSKLHDATIASKQAQIDATAAMQAHKENETANLAKAATNIFKTFGTLDKTVPDFPQKVYQTLADNPEAVHNPEIMAAVQHQLTTHENYMQAQAKANTLAVAAAAKQANPNAALEDALAASHPVYGTLAKGATGLNPKDFTVTTPGTPGVPDPDNAHAQTHVLTTYVTPQGKVETQVFPRDVFDASVSNAQKRAQIAAGVPTPAAPTPAAPADTTPTQSASGVAPVPAAGFYPGPAAAAAAAAQLPEPSQAHIDYLKANPNLAPDFDAKFGAGASQQYLTPATTAATP